MKIESLKKALARISDPRRDYGNIRHKLEDMLIIGLCSTICGGTGFEDMEEFAETRLEWLQSFLSLPNGIPSADTFRRLFERLDDNEVSCCLYEWLSENETYKNGGRAVNIDGKTLRGSADTNQGRCAYHVLNAWVGESGITLGQLKTEEKSNEITAIPVLLDAIEVEGDIISIDAMGCQKEIAAKIRSKGAEYVLAVKENHPTLYADIADYFTWAQSKPDEMPSAHWKGELEKDHGRIERREITIITEISDFPRKEDWQDLHTIIRYECTQIKKTEKKQTERYYISSFDTTPEQFGSLIRGHWSIENQLHWMLDVLFLEDASLVKKDHAPQNLSALRKVALACLKQVPTPKKVSIRRKMLRAALDVDFLALTLFRR